MPAGHGRGIRGAELSFSPSLSFPFTPLTSFIASKLGYYLPWGVFGAILNALGNGLLSTLSPTTSVPSWAGYESLVGFGRGAISQVVSFAFRVLLLLLQYTNTYPAHDCHPERGQR